MSHQLFCIYHAGMLKKDICRQDYTTLYFQLVDILLLSQEKLVLILVNHNVSLKMSRQKFSALIYSRLVRVHA